MSDAADVIRGKNVVAVIDFTELWSIRWTRHLGSDPNASSQRTRKDIFTTCTISRQFIGRVRGRQP